jgi:hypothetical protein
MCPYSKGRPDGCQVSPNASAILYGEWRHALLTVSRPILHERAAQVPFGKLPGTSKIRDAIANVCFRLKQSGQGAPVAQHGGRCRTDLHEADLTDPSDSIRVISTLDLCDRVSDIGRETHLLGFTPDGIEMSLAPRRIGPGHPHEALNSRRQRDIRKIGLRCLYQGARSKEEKSGREADSDVVWSVQ